MQLVALNLEPITGGPFGIGFIPRPFADYAGDPLVFSLANLGVLVVIVLALYLVLERLARSSVGQGAAGDPRGRAGGAARSARTRRKFRLQAFAIGGGIMGVAGAVQAHFIGFIAPGQLRADADLPGLGDADRRRLRQQQGAILGAVLVWGIWALSAAAVSGLRSRPASRRGRQHFRSS